MYYRDLDYGVDSCFQELLYRSAKSYIMGIRVEHCLGLFHGMTSSYNDKGLHERSSLRRSGTRLRQSSKLFCIFTLENFPGLLRLKPRNDDLGTIILSSIWYLNLFGNKISK